MATETLKTTAITNMDATPPLRATAGKEGPGMRAMVLGSVNPSNAVTSGSLYRLARVPSNVRNLKVSLEVDGTITTLTGDVTLYYSDLSSDEVGSGAGLSGLVNNLSGASALFATAYAAGGQTAGVIQDITNKSGNYGPLARQKELWDAAGLSSDPGGFFDVVFLTTATNSLTAGATLAAEVSYSAPYL